MNRRRFLKLLSGLAGTIIAWLNLPAIQEPEEVVADGVTRRYAKDDVGIYPYPGLEFTNIDADGWTISTKFWPSVIVTSCQLNRPCLVHALSVDEKPIRAEAAAELIWDTPAEYEG